MADRRLRLLAICLSLGSCHRSTDLASSRRDGQWVWSAADSAVRASAPGEFADAIPGVWVATILPVADSLIQRLALPPAIGGGGPTAAVVRFDPSLDSWWAGRSDAAVAAQIDRRLRNLFGLLERSATPIIEIQLDYDCPMRLLGRWSRVLHRLRRSALAGREVWITSLVAHQRDREFGNLIRGAVDGQIVQLFDTGDRPSTTALAELRRLIPSQGLPFRIGLGAFERRRRDGTSTDQTAWFLAVAEFRTWSGYRGLWIFPAGNRYRRLLGGDQ